jgi:hypothetical protein
VDCQELALFFGTLHEDSDPAVKEHNERKEALVNALVEKAMALLKLDKVGGGEREEEGGGEGREGRGERGEGEGEKEEGREGLVNALVEKAWLC